MSWSLVLVHSPSVGPGTWRPVAQRLTNQGLDAVVPDLRRVTEFGPPYWNSVAQNVVEAAGQLESHGPVLLVAHSNAGLFLPVVAEALTERVVGAVFVDAALPAREGSSPVAGPELVQWLRSLADDQGLLPRWTDWWPEEEVAALLPDPLVRAELVAEQARLPLDYYEQSVPVPPQWLSVPCAYLQFNEAYAREADQMRRAGWPTDHMPGEHLHQVVDPDGVTDAILRLAGQLLGH